MDWKSFSFLVSFRNANRNFKKFAQKERTPSHPIFNDHDSYTIHGSGNLGSATVSAIYHPIGSVCLHLGGILSGLDHSIS